MVREEGDCLVVEVSMRISTAASLVEAGRAAAARVARIDLSAVEEADSAGLAVLLDWQRVATAAGRRLSFSALPASLASLAALYGVDDLLSAA